MSETPQQRSHRPRRKRRPAARWNRAITQWFDRHVRNWRADVGRTFELLQVVSASGVTFSGACLLTAVVAVISAYTLLASVTGGDVCVPSHFVAATIARVQPTGHLFTTSAIMFVTALYIGRLARVQLDDDDEFLPLVLTLILQVVFIGFAVYAFDGPHSIRLAFDREWFSAEQIQARWADFQKQCQH